MAFASTRSERTVDDTVRYDCLTLLDDEPIGSGSFGVVYKVLHSLWGCQVAYKEVTVSYIAGKTRSDHKLVP